MSDRDDGFEFRPLTRDDFGLLHRWFNAPHARRWFGMWSSWEDMVEEYGPVVEGRVPIATFIVWHRGRAIGMAGWERFGDSPDFQRTYAVEDPDTANCDVLIGEVDVAHRGVGVAMIRAFLERVVFADPRIRSCVIDPEVDNAAAIRAYEKVGFRFLRALADDGEGNALYLMELTRGELHAPAPRGEAFSVRPAREGELARVEALDDDGGTLYAEAGIVIDAAADPTFIARERALWSRAIAEGRLLFACAPDGAHVGFASFGFVDGGAHLQQVSVSRAWMRRGVGRSLVTRAQRWSVRSGALWLTTYDHLPWNRPFYERMGFERVAEDACGPELRAILADERRALPSPERRVAMRYRHQ